MDDDMNKAELKKAPNVSGADRAGRQHARDALKTSIIRLESELSALRTLERAISWKLLNDEQEQDLWTYFTRVK